NAILERAPTSPIRLNPDVPAELERIINRALEKDRELRYQHASEMRAELQRLKRDTTSGKRIAVEEPPPQPISTSAAQFPVEVQIPRPSGSQPVVASGAVATAVSTANQPSAQSSGTAIRVPARASAFPRKYLLIGATALLALIIAVGLHM